MEVKEIDIRKIYPNDYNPNVMSESTYNHLKKTIQKIGFVAPIIVKKEKKGYKIVDGEHRWKVARELGIPKIPCVILETAEDERIITINMGKIRGEFDPLKYAETLMDLVNEYSEQEVLDLLNMTEKEYEQYKILLETPTEEELEHLLEDKTKKEYLLKFRLLGDDYNFVIQTLKMTGKETQEEALMEIILYYANSKKIMSNLKENE